MAKKILLFLMSILLLTCNTLYSQTIIKFDTTMIAHLKSLDNEMQMNQSLDWIKYAIINDLPISNNDKLNLLYDFSVLRKDFDNPIANYQYGESRSFILNDTVYSLIPLNHPQKNNFTLRHVDKFRMLQGKKPSLVAIYEYRLGNDKNTSAELFPPKYNLGNKYFTKEVGYVEKLIENESHLEIFLNSVDDVISVSKKRNGVLIGGRVYENYQGKRVDLEDVAVLYQADNGLKSHHYKMLINRGLYGEYRRSKKIDEEQIKQYKNILIAARLYIEDVDERDKFLQDRFGVTYNELMKFIELQGSTSSYTNFLETYQKLHFENVAELNIGFSLDPKIKYVHLANALEKMIEGDTAFFIKWYNTNAKKDDKKAIIFSNQEIANEYQEFYGQFFKSNSEYITDQDYDTLKEVSANSLFCSLPPQKDTTKEDKFDLSFWAKSFGVSDEELESRISEITESTYASLLKNKKYIKQIISFLKKKKGGARTNGLFMLKEYLSDEMDFEISPKYFSNSQSEEEKMVNSKILEDVTEMLIQISYLDKDVASGFNEDIESAIKRFQRRIELDTTGIINHEFYTSLIYLNPDKKLELSRLNTVLNKIQTSFTYQKGRYDGNLKGTKVGMTLYYTDLVMKLWGMNYMGCTPQDKIDGFYSTIDFLVSPVHKRDIEKNSSTRSWLGHDNNSFNFYKRGNELLLEHCITKIYNASSNDLHPGVEVRATFPERRFANWWNSNYSKVADYESEFHRLNQIMKWTIIVYWLKEKNQFSWLSSNNSIARNLDFEKWYKLNNDKMLTTTPPISFIDRRLVGEKTECIEILKSDPFNMFYNDFGIWQLSGGVGLPKKSEVIQKIFQKKNLSIDNTFRKGLNKYTKDDFSSELLFNNGKKVELSYSNGKVNLNCTNSIFDSDEIVLNNLSCENQITFRKNKNSFSQNYNKTAHSNISFSKLGDNTLDLSLNKKDLIQYEFFLKEISESGNFRNELMNSTDLEFAYFVNNDVYLKLKNSNQGLKIYETEIPKIWQKFEQTGDIRITLNRKNYLQGKFQTAQDMQALVQKYPYKKIKYYWSGRKDLSLTNEIPNKNAKKVLFDEGGYSNEFHFYKKEIFIPNKNIAKDREIIELLMDEDMDFLQKIFTQDDFKGLVFSKKGDKIKISSNKISDDAFGKIDDLYDGIQKSDEIKAIRIAENDVIRFEGNAILRVPPSSKFTPNHKKIVQFVEQRLSENPKWKEIFQQAGDLDYNDIVALQKLHSDNLELAESFYQFKQVELPDGVAIADFRSFSNPPQFVLKSSSSSNPKVVSLQTNSNSSISNISEWMKKGYTKNGFSSLEELKNKTKPIKELLEVLLSETNASKIVTKEFNGPTFEVMKQIHDIKTPTRIVRDQDDIGESIKNAKESLFWDTDATLFLSTADLSDSTQIDAYKFYTEIQQIGVISKMEISYMDFLKALKDSSKTMIFLTIRGNEAGVLFSDQYVSYGDLYRQLDSIPKKKMIYLLTNACDTLQYVFAESNNFSQVYFSCFQLCNNESVKYVFNNTLSVINTAINEEVTIKKRDFNRLNRRFPDIQAILKSATIVNRRNVTIKISQIPAASRIKLPDELSKVIDKDIGYKPKNILDIIDETQLKKINELKLKPQPHNILQKIKAIPQFKCEVDQVIEFI